MGLQSSQGLTGKDLLLSSLTCLLAGFTSLWVVGPSFSSYEHLTILDWLPHWSLHRATDNMVTREREGERECQRQTEKASKTEVRLLCNPIMEMTSRHLYYILFVRSESLGPVHTHGKEITERCGSQEVRIIGNPARICQPHLFKVILEDMVLIQYRKTL